MPQVFLRQIACLASEIYFSPLQYIQRLLNSVTSVNFEATYMHN